MKKIIAIVFSLVLVFSLAGCGNTKTESEAEKKPPAKFYQGEKVELTDGYISYEIPAEWDEKSDYDSEIYEKYYMTSVGDSHLQFNIRMENMLYLGPDKYAEIQEEVNKEDDDKEVSIGTIEIDGVEAYVVSGIGTNTSGEPAAYKNVFFLSSGQSEGYHLSFYKSGAEHFEKEEYQDIIDSIKFN